MYIYTVSASVYMMYHIHVLSYLYTIYGIYTECIHVIYIYVYIGVSVYIYSYTYCISSLDVPYCICICHIYIYHCTLCTGTIYCTIYNSVHMYTVHTYTVWHTYVSIVDTPTYCIYTHSVLTVYVSYRICHMYVYVLTWTVIYMYT